MDLVLLINITYLLIVHIWLRCKGLTTYTYIVKHLRKEEIQKADQSDNISLKKGRNKLMPEELFDKINKYENVNRSFYGAVC